MTNKIGLVKYSLVSLIHLKKLLYIIKISFHSYHTRIFEEQLGEKLSPLLSWLVLDFRRKKDIFVCCRHNTYTLRVPQLGRLSIFFMS